MTVFGRLGALLVVLSGAALLFIDGLRSPPGLWFAAAGIVAGAMMILYTAISSLSLRRPQPAPAPVSPGRSEESGRALTTQQTDPMPADTEQTAKSTETGQPDSRPASDNDPDPSELQTSEQSGTSSTTVMKPQHLPATTHPTQRTSSYTPSSRTKKTLRASTHQQTPTAPTATPKRNYSTGTDNSYFKPVDSSDEINLVQIDTKFSYIDVDWGPEFIGLDPIPDLIEVDVGPSAVSYELVRSPVEIRISSFLKALLVPTTRSSGSAAPNDSGRSSMAANNHNRRRTDDTDSRRRSEPCDTWETRDREQAEHVDHRQVPLTVTERRGHPAETWPWSNGPEPGKNPSSPGDRPGYGSREERDTFEGERPSNRRSLGWAPVMGEDPIGPEDVGLADGPVVDVGTSYSLPRREPPQCDANSFGLTDVGPRFSEFEESVVGSVEQPEIRFGTSDSESRVLIEEPVVDDPETGAEMLGLDGFAESPVGAVGLPDLNVENESSPLFPEGESFFPEEHAEGDWLMF